MPILMGPWAHARPRYPGTPTLATTPPATAVVRKSRRFMVGPPWPGVGWKRGDYRPGGVGEPRAAVGQDAGARSARLSISRMVPSATDRTRVFRNRRKKEPWDPNEAREA